MGRKTFQSIGRPLPGRLNIVVSRDVNFSANGITVVNDTESALRCAGDVEEVVIIGGGNIYQQFMSVADELYLTHIDIDVDGDAHFPDYTKAGSWEVIWQQTHKKANGEPYDYRFVHMVRVT